LRGPFAVLGMHSARPRSYSEADVAFLQGIANILAAAVQRFEAEENARKEQILRSTQADATQALILVLDAEGKMITCNRTCQELLGCTKEKMVARPVWEFLLPESERADAAELGRRLRDTHEDTLPEHQIITKDGELRWISWSKSAIGDNGDVESIIMTGIDVTERRQLERQVVEATEQERQRLGRELHDDLCQYLAALGMMADILRRKLEKEGLEAAVDVGKIRDELAEALTHARLLSHGLSPRMTQTDDIVTAFRELALYVEKAYQVRCAIHFPPDLKIGDQATAVHLFRIAQEAVNNALRHGEATEVDISAELTADGSLLLKIKDNGRGFSTPGQGTGIRNMKQRAAMIGGRLDIDSTPGEGTVLRCLVNEAQRRSS